MKRALLLLVLVCTLAGCATQDAGCPAVPEVVVTVLPPALIAPPPGATGVPPAAGLTVQISVQVSPDERIRLVSSTDGTFIDSGPLTAAPTAQFPQEASATLPALAAHTTYSVKVFGSTPIVSGRTCVPAMGGSYFVPTTGNGSFTTQ